MWVFDLGDFLASEKRTEYVAILSSGIVLMPTGGISLLKVLKCLNPQRRPSLQVREAAQMIFYHPLHEEMSWENMSFVTSKWSLTNLLEGGAYSPILILFHF